MFNLFDRDDIVHIPGKLFIKKDDSVYGILKKAVKKGFDVEDYNKYYNEREKEFDEKIGNHLGDYIPKGLHYEAEGYIQDFRENELKGLYNLLAHGYLNKNNELMYVPFALSLGKSAKTLAELHEGHNAELRKDYPEYVVSTVCEDYNISREDLERHMATALRDFMPIARQYTGALDLYVDFAIDAWLRDAFFSYYNCVVAPYMFTDNTELAKKWYEIARGKGLFDGNPEHDDVLRLLDFYEKEFTNKGLFEVINFLDDRCHIKDRPLLLKHALDACEKINNKDFVLSSVLFMIFEAKDAYLEAIYGIKDSKGLTYQPLSEKEKIKYNISGKKIHPERIQEMIIQQIMELSHSIAEVSDEKTNKIKYLCEKIGDPMNVYTLQPYVRDHAIKAYEKEKDSEIGFGSVLISCERTRRYNYVKFMEKWLPVGCECAAGVYSPAIEPIHSITHGK